MEDLFPWMVENAHWIWLSAGVLLLAGEILAPGFYLIWVGAAAMLTGVLAWVSPDMGFSGHGIFFAVVGTLFVYAGHRFFYKRAEPEPEKPVNTRGQRHVGQTYVVAEAITNGRGHVTVGDGRWLAEGPDTAEGEKVRVISVEGTILKVESIKE